MAYNEVVQAIADAQTDAQTLEEVVNGAPDTQANARLGRKIWTLATINSKIEYVRVQADAAKTQIDAKVNELDNAINTALAASVGDTGWTATLVTDKSGLTQQQINDGIASLNDLKAINPKTADVKVLLNSVVLGKSLGGGTFISVAKGSLVTDGGTIVESANANYLWQRINYAYVTPEMFGALGEGANEYTQVQAAVNTGKTVYLDKIYAIGKCIKTAVVGQRIFGKNRKTSGLIAKADVWVNAPDNGVIRIAHNNCYLHDFVADANNVGSAPSNRTNGCFIVGDNGTQLIGWTIERVDALNATGYAHVAFGVEANPLTSGYYSDCMAYNSQVLFEQLACDTIALDNCVGISTSRTIECFHPYASVKNITYTNCKTYPVSDNNSGGIGINIVSVNNYDLGTIKFINCDVYVAGTGSAVAVNTANNKAKIQFIGGSYRSKLGASASFDGPLEVGVYAGAKFDGEGGFNCSTLADSKFTIDGSDIVATGSAGATWNINALITNSANVVVSGGSITATGGGGQVAVLGAAKISAETRLIPAPASSGVKILKQGHGRVAFTPDGNRAFANIFVDFGDISKFHLSLSVNNNAVQNTTANLLNWQVVETGFLRVWATGLDANSTLDYHWIKFA